MITTIDPLETKSSTIKNVTCNWAVTTSPSSDVHHRDDVYGSPSNSRCKNGSDEELRIEASIVVVVNSRDRALPSVEIQKLLDSAVSNLIITLRLRNDTHHRWCIFIIIFVVSDTTVIIFVILLDAFGSIPPTADAGGTWTDGLQIHGWRRREGKRKARQSKFLWRSFANLYVPSDEPVFISSPDRF